MRFHHHSLLLLLLNIITIVTFQAHAANIRSSGSKIAFTWIPDPHATDPCTEPGCVNHTKYGFKVEPMNITNDQIVIFQEAKRPSDLSAVMNLETYTQPGCVISGCHIVKMLGFISHEECYNQEVRKTPDQPDGQSVKIDFGGIYYEHLPEGELYAKYERKNYLTGANTCTYEIRSGYKRWF